MSLPQLPNKHFSHCAGFPGYAVTDTGEIWSCRRPNGGLGEWRKRKIYVVRRYWQAVITRNGHAYTRRVHRLMLEAFRGPCPNNCETRHLNGNALDNRLANLTWGTRQENSDDKRKHGTMQSGDRNGQAKLTKIEVQTLRSIRPNHTVNQLSVIFGISRSQVKRIIYGQSWK